MKVLPGDAASLLICVVLSLEGYEEVNDDRRGKGVLSKSYAVDLLKTYGLIFGTSICYAHALTLTQ